MTPPYRTASWIPVSLPGQVEGLQIRETVGSQFLSLHRQFNPKSHFQAAWFSAAAMLAET